jgi:hypothetical protein
VSNRDTLTVEQEAASSVQQVYGAAPSSMSSPLSAPVPEREDSVFRAVRYAVDALLILSILLAAYSAIWEFSTRRYLQGFSDAIIPAASSTENKVDAILNWMSIGPRRADAGYIELAPDRDPTDTLNRASLLKVCGSATNAFINLATSGGMRARRLLLLDSRRITKHVVAEVLIDGRWVIVDPAFRALLRGPDGRLLTQHDLTDPAIFSAATGSILGYDPTYTYGNTAHIHLARLGFIGNPLRAVLDRILPGWEDSPTVSLLLERESLATTAAAIFLVFFLVLARLVLRWYGRRYYLLDPSQLQVRFRRAHRAFAETAK